MTPSRSTSIRDAAYALIRRWGLVADSDDAIINVLSGGAFVSHCAVEVCSAGNLPNEHFCRRHRSLDVQWAIYQRALQEIVDLRGTEDKSRLIAAKALGDASEYANTGGVAHG